MKSSVSRLLLLLQSLGLLALYAVFFTIQLLCMPAQDSNLLESLSILSFHSDKSKAAITESQNDHVQKTKLNITRRFQHAITDDVAGTVEIVVKQYNLPCYTIRLCENLVNSFTISSSLRGPPSLS